MVVEGRRSTLASQPVIKMQGRCRGIVAEIIFAQHRLEMVTKLRNAHSGRSLI